MYAAQFGYGDIVRYLHQAGADTNIRNIYGSAAVMYVAHAYE